MARLTGFSRLIITLVIVAGLFFLARKFLPQLGFGGSDPAVATQTQTSPGGGTDISTAPSPSSANSAPAAGTSVGGTNWAAKPFNYTATAPTGGKLKGVVELGATGFNSFIVRIDGQKNWKLEKAEYGASLVYEKLATDDDIRQGLKRYIADMLAFGVGPGDIHFVISSGAKKVEITGKIIETLRSMKYVVNEVTPEREGQLALKCALPKSYEGQAFVVDIGSGNTKISWMKGGAVTAFEAPGAKYFQNGMTDDAVYNQVKGLANNIPGSVRGTCFIIGGVPFELAKQTRSGKERYTVLKSPAGYNAEGEKQRAGLNIYRGIADATDCRQFVFDWDANFTIGFLLGL